MAGPIGETIRATADAADTKAFRLSLDDFEDVAEAISVTDINVTQISRGRFSGRLGYVQADAIHLVRLILAPGCVTRTEVAPDLVFFLLPAAWDGRFTYNGQEATRGNFFRFSDVECYCGVSAYRDVLTIALDRKEVQRTIGALRGQGCDPAWIGDGPLDLPSPALDRLRTRLVDLVETATSSGKGQNTLAAGLESAKTSILDYYFCASGPDEVCTRALRQSTRIVRAAEERFVAAGHEPVSLADLCEAADVSASTLNAAFQFVTDQSPLRYFKYRRLARARSSLARAEANATLVKQAAIDAGLTELGRFSVEYRELFDEAPSATLRRPFAGSTNGDAA